ncbi:MAG: hypothetical protein HY080_10185 [Gammaproteobacteria bacterium]|nr:hypothetical protein [Gammaproteobacteria bacterium]
MKMEKCPVCDWEIKDDGIKVRADEKEITVCCAECAKTVKQNLAKYMDTAR